jgi:hypothetical protein
MIMADPVLLDADAFPLFIPRHTHSVAESMELVAPGGLAIASAMVSSSFFQSGFLQLSEGSVGRLHGRQCSAYP